MLRFHPKRDQGNTVAALFRWIVGFPWFRLCPSILCLMLYPWRCVFLMSSQRVLSFFLHLTMQENIYQVESLFYLIMISTKRFGAYLQNHVFFFEIKMLKSRERKYTRKPNKQAKPRKPTKNKQRNKPKPKKTNPPKKKTQTHKKQTDKQTNKNYKTFLFDLFLGVLGSSSNR